MLEDQEFSQLLLEWFDRAGRKHLPWQKNPTLYRVWVSEIMLQQTQVATVIPYYLSFMRRFPSLRTLAAASIDEVLHYWTGLGYYARARNLHQAAGLIDQQHGGRFPREYRAVLALPGVGRSTVGAVLSLALDQCHAILDGNVKRVLTRSFAISGWPGKAKIEQRLWQLAERLTPVEGAKVYNQAIMDLGATVCTRRAPDCGSCPLLTQCQGLLLGNPEAFPTSKPRKQLPVKRICMLLVHNGNGGLLLERRPPSGIWGGLWSLPECPAQVDLPACLDRLGVCGQFVGNWPVRRHTFTHFHLDITPLEIRVDDITTRILDGDVRVWYNTLHPDARGLATPVLRLIEELESNSGGKSR